MRNLALTAFAASALLLTSCSDEPTAPTVVGSYVRGSGAYVIHSNVDVAIDAATNKTTETPAADDSTVVAQRTSTGGVEKSTSYVFENNTVADTVVMMQNGSVVMQDYPIRYDVLGIVLDLGRKQVTVADFGKSSWTALKDTILPFDFPAFPGLKLSGSLNFIGKLLGDESVTINGTTLATKKVQLDLNAVLTASIGATVPIGLVRTIWFADGIGIVKTEQKAAVIDLGPAGALLGTQKQAIPGFVQTAKRWSTGS
ncbi:MAG: hypothetical protein ACKOE4_06025 [Candidatus Kapaibacterium sp.]